MPPHVRAQGTFVQSVSLDKKWACYWRALSSWGRRRRTRHNKLLLETTASYYYKTLWFLQKLRTSSLPLHRSWTTYRRGRFYWTCFSRMLWNVSCKKYTLYARREEIAFEIGVGGNLLCCYIWLHNSVLSERSFAFCFAKIYDPVGVERLASTFSWRNYYESDLPQLVTSTYRN